MTHSALTESTLVSIVVPVFNADATLPRCIGSLLGQTCRNIEVIVVNDASTVRILGELAARDNRVRVENLAHNVGVHGARRIGVRASRGNFIGFADSDDWMAPGMYAHLLQEAQCTGADIVVCGADCVSENGLPLPPKVSFPVRRVVEDDLLRRFCRLEFGSGLQWNKLYRAPLIRRYSELELSRRIADVGQDYIVNIGCFASARRVVTVPERHYSYVVRSKSISNSVSRPVAFLRVLASYVACLEAYRQEFPQHFPLIDELYARQLQFDSYRVTSIEELAEVSEGLRDCLARLAAVHPEGVYSLLHAFDQRLNEQRRDSLKTALSNFGHSGMRLARTIGRTFRPRRWIDWLRSSASDSIAIEIIQTAFRSIWPASSPRAHAFEGSEAYWENRYQSGGTSGPGSYGDLAKFKAEVLNAFVAAEGIQSVIEFGCGDGHQLCLARYPRYLGLDVSRFAIARCKRLFSDDPSKEFKAVDEYAGETADAVLSLDVIYHLVEDHVFDRYMATVFDSAQKWVVIYSSNFEGVDEQHAEHVCHRKFTEWITANRPGWDCVETVKNPFPFTGDIERSSHADFYFFARRFE
jgi:glycosyltransferase involved in cell wall biosynthesis